MEDELKQYLEGLSAGIMAALQQMETRMLSALQPREQPLDAVSRRLEGLETETDTDAS